MASDDGARFAGQQREVIVLPQNREDLVAAFRIDQGEPDLKRQLARRVLDSDANFVAVMWPAKQCGGIHTDLPQLIQLRQVLVACDGGVVWVVFLVLDGPVERGTRLGQPIEVGADDTAARIGQAQRNEMDARRDSIGGEEKKNA